MASPKLSVYLLLALLFSCQSFAQNGTPAPGSASSQDTYYTGSGNGGYDALHYALELDVDMETGSLNASATIDARATQALSTLNLDLWGLTVSRVTVDGVEAGFVHEGLELTITPAAPIASGESFQTRVDYSGIPDLAPDASVQSMGMEGTGWMRRESGIYVMSECVGASGWFPCNDHPSDKATMSYRVRVAKPYVVAANGLLLEELDHGDTRTYVWRANDPMSTYLATVNIGEFELELGETKSGMPLRIYYAAETADKTLDAFRKTEELIDYFASIFGEYPFEAYGAVLSAESLGGALESQTLPVYSRRAGEGVLAHELAHQWFGNCVGLETWADMWLNEGFAVYASWLWREHTDGPEAIESSAKRTYERVKRMKTGAPTDPGEGAVFGMRTYGRGPLVLHALRLEVGDETFFRILKAWVERYFNASASSADFVAISEDVAGRELTELFDTWLYSESVPESAPAFD